MGITRKGRGADDNAAGAPAGAGDGEFAVADAPSEPAPPSLGQVIDSLGAAGPPVTRKALASATKALVILVGSHPSIPDTDWIAICTAGRISSLECSGLLDVTRARIGSDRHQDETLRSMLNGAEVERL